MLVENVAKLLFEVQEKLVCTEQPLCCTTTASFIVNTRKLGHPDDIRMDDMGSWINIGVDRVYISVKFTSEKAVSFIQKLPCKPSVMRKSIYCVTRTYWKHKQSKLFTRQLCQSYYNNYLKLNFMHSLIVIDWEKKEYPLVFLRYIIKGDVPPQIQAIAHGNSKDAEDGTPYYRTKTSARQKMEVIAKTSKPRNVYHYLFEEAGGVSGCQSMGDLPRNSKQVSNVRYKLSDSKSNDKDGLYEIMKKCVDEQSRSNPFIRNVQAAPEATCVLAADYQLNDLERFCTKKEFSVMGIDPTFNLGEFALTVTTYRHLMLESRRTGKPPVMIGPMFAHQKKEAATYHAFASSLLGLKSSLKGLKCVGTDGELAIFNGFQLAYPECQHILCFLHLRRNITHKLTELGVKNAVAKEILNDIFGFQKGTHRVGGLVDSTSEEEFDKKLQHMRLLWDSREDFSPQFYNWFITYHAENNYEEKNVATTTREVGYWNE